MCRNGITVKAMSFVKKKGEPVVCMKIKDKETLAAKSIDLVGAKYIPYAPCPTYVANICGVFLTSVELNFIREASFFIQMGMAWINPSIKRSASRTPRPPSAPSRRCTTWRET